MVAHTTLEYYTVLMYAILSLLALFFLIIIIHYLKRRGGENVASFIHVCMVHYYLILYEKCSFPSNLMY